MKKLTHKELVARQEARESQTLPFEILLNNIRSLYNVGSIFRTADGAGVSKIWICGITGMPPAPKISKTALDAEEVVNWEYVRDARKVIQARRAEGYEIILLEQTHQSIPYYQYEPEKPVCLVLGNEIFGVAEDLLADCDRAIEIDMSGIKNSLNVTVAFAVTAYHIRRQFLKQKDLRTYAPHLSRP